MLLVAFIFIINGILLIPLLVISYFVKFTGNVEVFKIVADLFKDITEKEHIIVLFAIGAVTATSVGSYIIEKAKSWKKPSFFGDNTDITPIVPIDPLEIPPPNENAQ